MRHAARPLHLAPVAPPALFLTLPRFADGGAVERVRRATRGLRLPNLGAKVTGSNGKGSTSHLIAYGLAEAGLRVGLFTSPHMLDPRERARVVTPGGTTAIPAEALWAPVDGVATRFEALTVAAARYFADIGVDAVVWEAGIGGRLDATRAFDCPVTVLTHVALEHTNVLGTTLPEITADKADLTTPGGTLIVGPIGDALVAVARARVAHCRLVSAPVATALRGAHQGWNAACAVAALDTLLGTSGPGREHTGDFLRTTRVPGRFEALDGQLWVDAAHNVSGLEAALMTARATFGDGWTLLFGASADRDVEAMARAVDGAPRHIVVTEAHHKGAPLERVSRAFAPRSVIAVPTPRQALELARGLGPEPVLATGGLFHAAEIMAEARGTAADSLVWF